MCDSVIAGRGLRASREVRRSGWAFGGAVVRVCGGMPYKLWAQLLYRKNV